MDNNSTASHSTPQLGQLPLKIAKLDNGLTVLMQEQHASAVVAVQIWVGVGSADELPGERGMAHFCEHMLFKGTTRRGVGQVALEIEGAGGNVNASTSHDATVYYATLPSSELATGIDALCDMVRHPSFPMLEIAREIEVVSEEIRGDQDSPSATVTDALFSAAYATHGYRSPILGTLESVAAFKRGDLVDFFRRWYGPDNLTVVLVGDFSEGHAFGLVRDAFAGAEARGARRARTPEPPRVGLRHTTLRRSFERASVRLAWPVPALSHPDVPLLDLLARLLGGCDTSRLVQSVKEPAGFIDYIGASAHTPLDAGLFCVSFGTDAGHTEAAFEAVIREIERARRGLFAVDELERAKVNFLASEHFARETVSGLADKLGYFAMIAGDPSAEARYLDAIRRATPSDLMRVARDYLRVDVLTVAAVLPETALRFDRHSIDAAMERGTEEAARKFAPAVRKPAAWSALVSYQLSCGAMLHVAPRRDAPIVALRAACLGGQIAEDESNTGISTFLASMLLRGTECRSALELARNIEGLAAELQGFSGRSSFGLALRCPTDRLAPSLELFAEVLLRPGFDQTEIERERRDTLAAQVCREDRFGEKAFELFQGALFEGHPYQFPQIGLPTSVSQFDKTALSAHHLRLVRAENLVLGAAGDVDPDTFAASINALLAAVPRGAFAPSAPALCAAPTEPRRIELLKPCAQSHLVVGFRGLTVLDEDRFALDIISHLFAGQGGRLFAELRDRQGLVYTVGAANSEAVVPGFFALYVATAPEKLAAAERALMLELRRLVDTAPPEDELQRAKRYLIGRREISHQRSVVRAAHIALGGLYGMGADVDRFEVERMLSVTRDDVLRVARRLIDLKAPTTALVSAAKPR